MFLSSHCISVQNRISYPWETEREEASASSVYSVLKSLSQQQGQPEPSAAAGFARHAVQRTHALPQACQLAPEFGGLVDAPIIGQST